MAKPTIGDDDVLVQVHATTVNRTDCACRAAKPFFMRLFTGLIRPRATVLGNEFAGVVEAVGSGVTAFSVGEKVFGYNEGPFGAHAQYLAIPEDGSLTTMPANVTYEEAAASTEGAHYALAHIRGARITSGQDVLVYGATGAIGSAAVQLLKSLGVNVTAVCATDTWTWSRAWALTGSSTTPPRISPRTIRPTTWSWTRSARVPSASAGRLLKPARNLRLLRARSACAESVPGADRSASAGASG